MRQRAECLSSRARFSSGAEGERSSRSATFEQLQLSTLGRQIFPTRRRRLRQRRRRRSEHRGASPSGANRKRGTQVCSSIADACSICLQYIGRHIQLDKHPSNTERVQATLETIGISMNYQLRSLIEWAKDLKGFIDLSDNDKVSSRGVTAIARGFRLDCASTWSHG